MILIRKLENRFIILTITLLVIILIGYLDYITGSEFSFSLFYLIPISLLALYRNTKIGSVVGSAIFASLVWFLAEYLAGNYSAIYFPIWNAFVRLVFFSTIGLLLLYLKEKDKKLNQVNENLKASNEEKNKFIGIAAHDLRNPISGIYSFSDLILNDHKDDLTNEIHDLLSFIRTLSNNTLVVLRNLLDVSKIESGKVELNLFSQDYITFIRQQILLNQILAKHKNTIIVLENNIDNIVADFDHHYLSQTIDNLLSNAIKYSYKNSQIIVRITLTGKRQILTEVIDSGKGIPLEEQQKLFNYFQTTSTRPTNGENSTGLGLAIAKRVISLHNGEIGVKSAPNTGSTFYFTFPLTQKNN